MSSVLNLVTRKLSSIISKIDTDEDIARVSESPRQNQHNQLSVPIKDTPAETIKGQQDLSSHKNHRPPRHRRGTKKPKNTKQKNPLHPPTHPRSDSDHFGNLQVSLKIGRALSDLGYRSPTPIQKSVIPIVRTGRDVVGQAQTGTGKTAAFGIPIIEKINTKSRLPQALILTPTRELAMQVSSEISKIGRYRSIKVVAIYGGQPMQPQIDVLRTGVHVIVATPGRLMDHMNRRTLSLKTIRMAILDEADQMLDIGFIDDIEHILRQTPRSRQTLLFSATIPYPIRKLTRRYLNNPDWIREGGDAEPVDQVEQVYYEVAAQDRRIALKEILDLPDNVSQALVFRRTKAGVDRLVSDLRRNRYDAEGIHSDMTQIQRERVIQKFRAKRLRLLVATNVASRGLDIPAVSHVINYDMPDNLEEYVHRIGRTARAGRRGTAITFVSDLQDFELLDVLQEQLGHEINQANLNLLYS